MVPNCADWRSLADEAIEFVRVCWWPGRDIGLFITYLHQREFLSVRCRLSWVCRSDSGYETPDPFDFQIKPRYAKAVEAAGVHRHDRYLGMIFSIFSTGVSNPILVSRFQKRYSIPFSTVHAFVICRTIQCEADRFEIFGLRVGISQRWQRQPTDADES